MNTPNALAVGDVLAWDNDTLSALEFTELATGMQILVAAFTRQQDQLKEAETMATVERERLQTLGGQLERLKGAMQQQLAKLPTR